MKKPYVIEKVEVATDELEALDRVIAQQGLISRRANYETQASVDYKLLKALRNKLPKKITEEVSEKV